MPSELQRFSLLNFKFELARAFARDDHSASGGAPWLWRGGPLPLMDWAGVGLLIRPQPEIYLTQNPEDLPAENSRLSDARDQAAVTQRARGKQRSQRVFAEPQRGKF